MTAHLQPGDRIHIAVGINSTNSVELANRQVAEQLKTFEQAYGSVGVTILTITGTPGLLHPVIVAVIREPERRLRSAEKLNLGEDPPLPWQEPEATEPPRAKEFLPHGLPPE